MKQLSVDFLSRVSNLLEDAHKNIKTAVNLSMVYTYYSCTTGSERVDLLSAFNGNPVDTYSKKREVCSNDRDLCKYFL